METKRKIVSEAYDSARWRERVKSMPDNQIIAIYNSLKAQGKVK